ncbi:MAG TPA: NAD(P)H-dependent oxidoreductase subunit E [Planctomycetota bacterium]|nr:NAD(P)H-dependent oxidoreductase subunit E [Planctomycetota bacterium]
MTPSAIQVKAEDIQKIAERAGPGGLIAVLEQVQDKYGYLPPEALRLVADKTGRPLADVFGVATFYRSFRLEPRGRHMISVCLGTACHVRGAPAIAEEFERQLATRPGGTTPDGEFSFETVNCLGACALGPIVVVDGRYFSNVKPSQVAGILAKTREGFDRVEIGKDERLFPVELHCPRCNHSLMDPRTPIDNLPSIKITIAFENQHGPLYLSCLYGSFNIQSPLAIPMNTVLDFFCPHCYATLAGSSNCTACGAPLIPMVVGGGGLIQVCARRGCHEHRLDLDAVNA